MKKIFFHNERKKVHPLRGKIKKYKNWLLDITSREGGVIDEIHYIFCDDDYILEINQKFLNHDYYTDIITFPYSQEKNKLKADIYISIDTVRSNAVEYFETFEHELHRVMAHGMLHLLGYNDKTERDSEVMRNMENECLLLWSNEIY
jgi:probable rRNA maturation factor